MKRLHLCFFGLLVLISPLCAASPDDSVQIFMPEKPCIGDTAELRYIFHTDSNLMENEETHKNLPVDMPVFASQSEQCTVLSATLDRFDSEYTLSLSLIGWKAGQIDFAPFILQDYLIDLNPIEIQSVVEKTGASSFRPPAPPLVVPGTTAILAILGVVFILLLGLAVFALFHIPAIADFFTKSREERRIKKNMRIALKKLRTLAAKTDSLDDTRFCAVIQHILREYLSKRFCHDFAPVNSADLYAVFEEICGGELSKEQEDSVQRIMYLFNRTDYIRYAHAALDAGERETLLEAATKSVEDIGGANVHR
ncbi:MAG: hypothetical protein IJP62_06160 [Treponema sp.]|nr:hypothetical protein [Treponema sp.]